MFKEKDTYDIDHSYDAFKDFWFLIRASFRLINFFKYHILLLTTAYVVVDYLSTYGSIT